MRPEGFEWLGMIYPFWAAQGVDTGSEGAGAWYVDGLDVHYFTHCCMLRDTKLCSPSVSLIDVEERLLERVRSESGDRLALPLISVKPYRSTLHKRMGAVYTYQAMVTNKENGMTWIWSSVESGWGAKICIGVGLL